jgi:hypothetical protein
MKGHIKNGEIVEFRVREGAKLYKGRVEFFSPGNKAGVSPVYGVKIPARPAIHGIVIIAIDGEPIPQPRLTHQRKRLRVSATTLDKQNPNARRTKE